MKVVHLNTSVNESSAPYKLHTAFLQAGIESRIVTLEDSKLKYVDSVKKNIWFKIRRKVSNIYREHVRKRYKPIDNMPMSIYPVGIDCSKNQYIQDADVIMIHWVSADFLNPKYIERLIKLKKIVLWTCHDNNPFTGGCHVRLGCLNYQKLCGKCPQIESNNSKDPTRLLMREKKKRLTKYDTLTILSPSNWMDQNVSNSVFGSLKHYILPNVIDIKLFCEKDKNDCRSSLGINFDRYVILVGLKANEKIPYNGMEYLWNILNTLYDKYSDQSKDGKKIEIVSFGVEKIKNKSKFEVHNVGYINSQKELSLLYSAADVYMVTSLEDSFNQTVAECMACNTPVVAFDNGGIADIIDHCINGYLAKYGNVEDFIKGIDFCLENKNLILPRKKIEREFSQDVVVRKWESIVNKLI